MCDNRAYNCGIHTIDLQHGAVLIIFPSIFQTINTSHSQVMSILDWTPAFSVAPLQSSGATENAGVEKSARSKMQG